MKILSYLWMALAIVILVLTGLVHGFWTNRWGTLLSLDDAAAHLSLLPKKIGLWQGSDLALDPTEAQLAGYAASLWRRYDSPTGQAVSVLLICGRPGPVSAHTPDVCYQGEGYELLADPGRVAISAGPGPAGEFWKGQFAKKARFRSPPLLIYWSWNAGKGWQAPSSPRLAFARFPLLFKLYLISETSPGAAKRDHDPCAELLPLLLPELQKTALAKTWAGQ